MSQCLSNQACFNSTLVQLQVKARECDTVTVDQFQFHVGAITSLQTLERLNKWIKFQFHVGAITRFFPHQLTSLLVNVSIPRWCNYKLMIAVTGAVVEAVSIPRWCNYKDCSTARKPFPEWCFNSTLVQLQEPGVLWNGPETDWFQFHVGAITSLSLDDKIRLNDLVSIPRWCNYKPSYIRLKNGDFIESHLDKSPNFVVRV